MFPVSRIKVRSFEKGLLFKDGEFVRVLDRGTHWFIDLLFKRKVDRVSTRNPWLRSPDLDMIVRSGELTNRAVVLDLKDHQRALVWLNGRFDRILPPGLHALWTGSVKVETEVVEVTELRFSRDRMETILNGANAHEFLERMVIPSGSKGLYFRDGKLVDTLEAGQHVFWKNAGKFNVYMVDFRESVADITGQEIMTADKVTLRINGVVTYKVVDEKKATGEVEDFRQSLYREAQLVLRGVIGTRELDGILGRKDEVTGELLETLQARVSQFGLKVIGYGIKDIILPGEMKELLNQVTQARKAAEASVITRREETAAMRSQANTAKILESNPLLMKLKELETLEKVAATSKLNVVLGEKGLAERIVNLL